MSELTEKIDTMLEAKPRGLQKDLQGALRRMHSVAKSSVQLRDLGEAGNQDQLLIRFDKNSEPPDFIKVSEGLGFRPLNRRFGRGFYWYLFMDVDWKGLQRTKAIQAGSKYLRERGYLTAIDYEN